jgi:hypothetical protein
MIAGAVEEGDEIANNQGESDRGLKRIDTDERFWVGRAIKQCLISQFAPFREKCKGTRRHTPGAKAPLSCGHERDPRLKPWDT